MTTLLSLVPILLVIPLSAWVIRIAAKFVARSSLGWRDAFIVVGLMMALNVVLFLAQGMFEGVSAALFRAVLLVVQFCIGAWFLGPRCRNSDGQPGTFLTGLLVMGAVFALGISIGVLLALVGP